MKHLLQVMAVSAAAGAVLSLPVHAAAAEELQCTRAADAIVFDEEGRAYVPEEDGRKTGAFTLAPNFLLGDLNRDALVNAEDATSLLIAAADAGASGEKAEMLLLDSFTDVYTDADTARCFADVSENGSIAADDATLILIYAAQLGAGDAAAPLGTHTYRTDEEGFLQSGFFTQDGVTYYADETFALWQGWLEDAGKRYYLGEDGALLPEGWLKVGNTDYYVQEDGSIAQDTWLTLGDAVCYLDAQGAAADGFTEIDGETYLFAEHALVKGWITQGNARYYCSEDGIPQTGVQVIDGKTYYFDPETRQMHTGYLDRDGSLRYFDQDGVMLTGWQEIDGTRYYFNAEGARAVGLTNVDGDGYYFDENGAIVTGWVQVGKTMHYFGEDGVMYKMWHVIDDHQYCFGGVDGVMLTGWAEIGGKRYYFGTDGIMVTNQTVGDWYLTEDGTAITERLHVNKVRAQEAFAKNGTSIEGIYSYVRSTTRYKKIEATKTLAQIESIGWMYYVDYSMTHYYGVCYYLAAKMDFLLREAGYDCRMVHSTHNSGDHYWNQINVNGVWVNYDCTNGLRAKTWEQMVAFGSYRLIGYVTPEYE